MSIKEGDMVSIRQDFINRYKNVQESIIKAMDKALERAIGNKVIDFEKCEDNYLDVYPLIGAVLQKEVRRVLGENANKDIYRNMKIKATKYRNDYRVWLDYAGDYRNENVELEVVESSDASCEGCAFNNSKNYYCKDTHCIDVDRKDDIDVIYKEVKRS